MMAKSSERPPLPAMLIKIGSTLPQDVWKMLVTVLKVIFAPWRITHDSIAELLQADDASADAQAETNLSILSISDALTSSWTDRKLSELSWVGITVCGSIPRLVAPRN